MSGLFPLKLSPFEQYLFEDDRPGYRMTIGFELGFEGEIQRPAFENATRIALQRHPLLCSLIERHWFRKPRWLPAPGIEPAMDWGPAEHPIRLPSDEGIDLTREIGVRFFVRTGGGRSRMIVHIHHACCDGTGILQFLADLFAAYARQLPPGDQPLPELQNINLSQLHKRDCCQVEYWEPMNRLRFLVKVFCDTFKIVWNTPAPLATTPVAESRTVRPSYGTITNTLDQSVLPRLRQQARKAGVSINDLLVRELFLVLRDWNKARAAESRSQWLTVIVPNNLRNHEHDGIPAANLVNYTFFHRHLNEVAAPDTLLTSIHDNWRFSSLWVCVNGVRWLQRIPGGMRWLVKLRTCAGTAVLSYLGNPARAVASRFPANADGNPILGNLVLTELTSAPPVRPLTRASFLAWHFDNKLRLGVRCDPHAFLKFEAQQLVDLYCERVVALVDRQTVKPARRPAAA